MNKIGYVFASAAICTILMNVQGIDVLFTGFSQLMPLNLPHKH
ncbi:hypothetical protein [Sinobaca qinghaiensis]|nr:hypothetical protein [Sinobaca qinghaiensis]